MVPPETWYPRCSGGDLSPSGVSRNRGTFVSVTSHEASPWRGWSGGAPRSESKSNDCRGQSHIDFIVGSTPLHLYRISGRTIHPHRFYLPRGGRLIAAPTIHLFRPTKNCQLSIVHCQFGNNCQLQTRPQPPDSLRCLGAGFITLRFPPALPSGNWRRGNLWCPGRSRWR